MNALFTVAVYLLGIMTGLLIALALNKSVLQQECQAKDGQIIEQHCLRVEVIK